MKVCPLCQTPMVQHEHLVGYRFGKPVYTVVQECPRGCKLLAPAAARELHHKLGLALEMVTL